VKPGASRGLALGLDCGRRISRNLFTRESGFRGASHWTRVIAVSIGMALLAAGAWTIGNALWSYARTSLAQAFIGRAWERSLASGQHMKPWPWADARPVARLTVPRLGIERYVLEGVEDGIVWLGARHMYGTALPGEVGNSVIGGEADVLLSFLRELAPDTEIEVESLDGRWHRYTVRYVHPLDPRDVWITKQEGPARLTLITCSSPVRSRPGVPACHAVSAYATTGEDANDVASARKAPAQNTIFGRKTSV
jgi:sortase A